MRIYAIKPIIKCAKLGRPCELQNPKIIPPVTNNIPII